MGLVDGHANPACKRGGKPRNRKPVNIRTLGRKPHYGDQFSPAFTRGVGTANMHLAGPPSAARIPNHPNSVKHPQFSLPGMEVTIRNTIEASDPKQE